MIGLGQSGLCPEGRRGSNPCKPFVCHSWEGEERVPTMTTTGFCCSKNAPCWRTRVISQPLQLPFPPFGYTSNLHFGLHSSHFLDCVPSSVGAPFPTHQECGQDPGQSVPCIRPLDCCLDRLLVGANQGNTVMLLGKEGWDCAGCSCL